MSARTMSLNDFRRYLMKLRKNLIGHEGAAVRGIHSGVIRSVTVVQRTTMEKKAFNTGDYLRKWTHELLPRGGRVFNNHRAAAVLEDGRRRGAKRPPVREIELWARRKLGLDGKELKSAAFAIANAIAKRGLKPRRILKSSAAEITRVVMEEIHREVKAALKAGSKAK